MFENIIQQKALDTLIKDVRAKKVPQSMLFAGAENSAKLTSALELARVLSCTKKADWTCDCPSCASMRSMSSTDLLIIGQRDVTLEIKAAANTFLKMKGAGAHFLFSRAVKKLLFRFDARLWDTDENRFIKVSPLVSDSYDLLNDTAKFLENGDEKKLLTSVEKLCTVTEKIQDVLYDSIPVNQVRKASAWIRLAPAAQYKFLIVENAERMQESARAAFLKILEEPPRYSFFILTSTRPSAIMQTILSRVRKYNFLPRGNTCEAEIIERVFHDTVPSGQNENILDRYFQNFLPVPFEKIQAAADDFWFCLLENNSLPQYSPLRRVKKLLFSENTSERKTIAQILKSIDGAKNPTVFKILCGQITDVLQKLLNANENLTAPELEDLFHTTKIILKWKSAHDVYNISEHAALESMMMEIASLR